MASLLRNTMHGIGGGNPLATPVGHLIDQATDGSLASENWGLNMEICDLINETDEGPKDAMKALKKKMSANTGKNYTVIMYCLTVLETAVKNCGKRFHSHIAHKDFLQEMIKIISPKNDPPTVVQEKILSLIQTWADAFRGVSDLKEVDKVYQDLKKKGIEFPMTDLDSLAPIHTPARTSYHEPPPPSASPPARQPPQQQVAPAPAGGMPPGGMPAGLVPPQQQPPQAAPVGPVSLTPEQLGKLSSELDVVQQNCKVLSDMLTELTPGSEDPSDLELLQELNRTCRQMQQRVVELLNRVTNEDCIGELLRINDELNNVFLRYERFERYRSSQAGTNPAQMQAGPPTAAPPSYSSQAPAYAATANLIDFDAPSSHASSPPTDALQQRLSGIHISGSGQPPMQAAAGAGGDEEFDMFAASRQSFDTHHQSPPAYPSHGLDQTGNLSAAVNAKASGGSVSDRPTEYDEMEQWLEQNPKDGAQSATSSEFDAFLAQRARDVDTLPDVNASDARSNNARAPTRQMQSDDDKNALFSL